MHDNVNFSLTFKIRLVIICGQMSHVHENVNFSLTFKIRLVIICGQMWPKPLTLSIIFRWSFSHRCRIIDDSVLPHDFTMVKPSSLYEQNVLWARLCMAVVISSHHAFLLFVHQYSQYMQRGCVHRLSNSYTSVDYQFWEIL